MPLGLDRITISPTRSISWTLDLFWVLIPLTIACGIYDLGSVETIAWVAALFSVICAGIFVIAQLLGEAISPSENVFYSLSKGAAWGASMIFAWPTSWVGFVYLIIIFLNVLFVTISRWEKG